MTNMNDYRTVHSHPSIFDLINQLYYILYDMSQSTNMYNSIPATYGHLTTRSYNQHKVIEHTDIKTIL